MIKKGPIQKLTNNLYLKIGAVLVAIILWASVQASSDGIIENYYDIPITYTNAQYLDDNDFYLKDYADTITIKVKAKTSVMAKINKKAKAYFSAEADLSARIGDDLYRKLVQVQVTPNEDIVNEIVELSYKNSEWVNITLEPIQTKEFDIEVLTKGQLPDGYQISSAGFQVEPSSITLRAPESIFSKINKLAVYVSLRDAGGEAINQILQPVILDSNGKMVVLEDGMSFDTNAVNVTAELLKSKEIPVTIEGTVGTLAEGYQSKGISRVPDTITILGTLADLAGVNSVTIPKEELDIEGLTTSKEFAIDITQYLPDNVSLYGDNSIICVTVTVDELDERSYQISSDKIEMVGMLESKNYEMLTKNVVVTLKGLEEDLGSLKAEEIELSIDVSELHLGMNSKIPVTVQVRSGFSVTNSPIVTVRVLDVEESLTESVEETIEEFSSTLESESFENEVVQSDVEGNSDIE